MKKLNSKISYVVVGILTLIAFLFDYLLNKEIIGGGVYLLSTLIIIPACIYIMYLFVEIERKYAYLHAFISSMLVYLGSFWSYWPELIYYMRYCPEAEPDISVTLSAIIHITFFMHLVFWGFVYLMINYISKRKFRVKNI